MGKAQRFERRLQGIVGDAFARVFGGSVVPQEVAQALAREADDNARPLAGGRVLAPNRYTVTLGAADHDRLAGDEQRVIRMLKGCIQAHLTQQGWDVYGDVVVALKVSATLHTGQFRTSSSVDPDTPQPRTAGDGAMSEARSQPPVDPAGAGRRGQYRYDGVPAAAPDYGQPAGYAYPNSPYGHDVQGAGSSDNVGYYGYDQPAGRPDHRYDSDDDQQSYREATPGYADDQGGYRQLSAALILDDGSNRYHQLTEGTMVVGRGHDAQFRLPDTGVSRRHLEITWDGRTARLADLGSTNGTTVNGTPVQAWQLVDGDVVRVGQSRLVFRTQG
ncbi:MAG TPA: FhaA domain-containing protein [Pseudonocardiaceae bacterium]|nr:FhaA domain-containing protein [Pseudonocardiaceae bacterium]